MKALSVGAAVLSGLLAIYSIARGNDGIAFGMMALAALNATFAARREA